MISDETLTLYYYEDGLTDEERADVRRELKRDETLLARYEELCATMDALADFDATPAPTEAVVRWRYELDAAVATESRSPGWPFALLASAAAVLAFGIAIGLWLGEDEPTSPKLATAMPMPSAAPTAPAPALARGMSQYLRDTQVQLVGLQSADAERRGELVGAIIEQNRLFERAAERSGSFELARVLRAFEQTLNELARDEASPTDIDTTSDRLSFEYAVMLTKLSRDASIPPKSF